MIPFHLLNTALFFGTGSTATAKVIYKLRAQTAEWVNMLARNRGFYAMPVRGLAKCKTIAVLFTVTHNLLQGAKLRAEAKMSGG